MFNARQNKIMDYLTEHMEAKNQELADLAGDCSMMTLWRDLTKLEEEGLIVRFRGGAALSQAIHSGRESDFSLRVKQNITAKEEISKIAGGLIQPNHAYYLDAGSTVYTLTRFIHQGSYSVVTSAANVAAELTRRNSHSITLIGGQVNPATLACSGPQAEKMIEEINIDVAIMAASGYSESSGFTVGHLPESQLKKLVINKAAFTIMLLDHGKVSRNHPYTFAGLDNIDVLIGDRQMSRELIAEAERKGTIVFTPNDGLTAEQRVERVEHLYSRKKW